MLKILRNGSIELFRQSAERGFACLLTGSLQIQIHCNALGLPSGFETAFRAENVSISSGINALHDSAGDHGFLCRSLRSSGWTDLVQDAEVCVSPFCVGYKAVPLWSGYPAFCPRSLYSALRSCQ